MLLGTQATARSTGQILVVITTTMDRALLEIGRIATVEVGRPTMAGEGEVRGRASTTVTTPVTAIATADPITIGADQEAIAEAETVTAAEIADGIERDPRDLRIDQGIYRVTDPEIGRGTGRVIGPGIDLVTGRGNEIGRGTEGIGTALGEAGIIDPVDLGIAVVLAMVGRNEAMGTPQATETPITRERRAVVVLRAQSQRTARNPTGTKSPANVIVAVAVAAVGETRKVARRARGMLEVGAARQAQAVQHANRRLQFDRRPDEIFTIQYCFMFKKYVV
jgi:hypothetical protein